MTTLALVGQPNCGKSTLFNMLTGARQHVANYPGITVDIKKGKCTLTEGTVCEVVDLPGIYSLTSYSNEEVVTRDFILNNQVDLVINVLDSSNLKQGLYLTVQLIEMGISLLLALNMADVADRRGLDVDAEKLSALLNIPVVQTVGNRSKGRNELLEAIETYQRPVALTSPVNYEDLEELIVELTGRIAELSTHLKFPPRWGAIKLLEADSMVRQALEEAGPEGEYILNRADVLSNAFAEKIGDSTAGEIGISRHHSIAPLLKKIQKQGNAKSSLTDRIDQIVVHRFIGPLLLLGIIYLLYELSIIQGYKLTNYMIPWLSRAEFLIGMVLPQAGIIEEPVLRALVLGVVAAINSVLVYIPIFLILFACIAFLEDVGYMPRIAFILDRVLRRFGLQGQSTLPLILGGVFVGGCAVPGVMATRVIADERARIATILVVPLMNCLAKIPLYTLLLGAFFVGVETIMMVFISTITLFIALCAAKLLTLSFLRHKPSAPFIMELPPYHVPTVQGIVLRAYERTWIFCKKIGTVVVAVTIVVFFLTNYPSNPKKVMEAFLVTSEKNVNDFRSSIQATRFAPLVADDSGMVAMIDVFERDRKARLSSIAPADILKYMPNSSPFIDLVDPKHNNEDDVKTVKRAWRKYSGLRLRLIKQATENRLNNSALGQLGQWLTPITKFAGFNWKVNVSLLSALAAKESTVATLGMLYRPSGSIQEGLVDDEGYTALHALALMIFMSLYPPCLAALIMVKVETGGWKWPIISLLFPTGLGLLFASIIFTGGSWLNLSGVQSAATFYALILFLTVMLGLNTPKANHIA